MKIFTENNIQQICTNENFSKGAICLKESKILDLLCEEQADSYVCTAQIQAYQTKIKWDKKSGIIRAFKCNCPYKWVDMCEHEVGLCLRILKLHKKNLLSSHFQADKKDYKTNNIQIFLNIEAQSLAFKLWDHTEKKWLSYIPKDWYKTLSASLQNLIHQFPEKSYQDYFNIPLRNQGYLLSILEELKEVYFEKTKEKIIFENKPRNLKIKMERDYEKRTFIFSLDEKGVVMQKDHYQYYYFENGIFYRLRKLRDWDFKFGIELFLENIVEVGKVHLKFDYYDCEKFEKNVVAFLKKWNRKNCETPGKPEILTKAKYETHVWLKRIPREWDEEENTYSNEYIEVEFYFAYENKTYPIFEAIWDLIWDVFEEEEVSFHAQLKAQGSIKDFLYYYHPKYPLKKQILYDNGDYLLFENQEEAFFLKRDYEKEFELLRFWEKYQFFYYGSNCIRFCFPTKEFFDFQNKLTLTAQKKGWRIFYADNLKLQDFEKKKIKFEIDFDLNDEGLLSFDLKSHLSRHQLSEKQLLELINSDLEYLEWDDEYISIENKNEIKQLLDIVKTNKKNKKGTYTAPLWQAFALENFIENTNSKVKKNEKYKLFLSETQNAAPIQPVPLSKKMEKQLRNYQKKGINWMSFLRKYKFGGILADDMGLGKTIQSLAFIDSLIHSENPAGPFLIICPKTLIFNWEEEINKFFPRLKYLMVSGSQSERNNIFKKLKKPNHRFQIIITSYSLIKQDIERWKETGIEFDTIIIDEAQHIKNHKTKTSKAIKKMSAKYKLALSGTPLENGVSELWSIYDFLMPHFLGSYTEFRKKIENPIVKKGCQETLKSLSNQIRPFLLRRNKSEILKELPEKIEQNLFAELSKDQLALYSKILNEVKDDVFTEVENKGFEKSRILILAALTKLRQICNHPSLVDEKMALADSGKFDLCMELLEDAFEGNHKILVFSSFVKTLKLLEKKFIKEKIKYAYLDGQTKDRKQAITDFQNDPQCKVFLISLKAGGTGLNLTAADTVILFDPWWNPMVEMQAMDRAHRIGQKNIVNVYSLITKNTIEEKMLKVKKRKKQLFDGIVGGTDKFIEKLTWDDLRKLFED